MPQDPPSVSPAARMLEKLRKKAGADNRNYLTEGYQPQDAALGVINCPGCGAARAKGSNLRFCAYCNHAFLKSDLSDGVYLKKMPMPGEGGKK